MASESLSMGVDLFFAQEFCFFKQENGSPRGSRQAKTCLLLTTVLGPLHCAVAAELACAMAAGLACPEPAALGRVVASALAVVVVSSLACAGAASPAMV